MNVVEQICSAVSQSSSHTSFRKKIYPYISEIPSFNPDLIIDQVSESNFAAALAKHNSYLRNSTELRDDSYTLTVHDVKLLLLRFAHEQPFSSDSGGGGRNSNMLLIPYELLLALYVIST